MVMDILLALAAIELVTMRIGLAVMARVIMVLHKIFMDGDGMKVA